MACRGLSPHITGKPHMDTDRATGTRLNSTEKNRA
jgi:hypothetical protein